jgi:hypothetical protein
VTTSHGDCRGHQLIVFAEAGIKLLFGQSQGDKRPRPRSDLSNATTYRVFASTIKRRFEPWGPGFFYFDANAFNRNCAWRPTCHNRTDSRLMPATTAIFFRFGFFAISCR